MERKSLTLELKATEAGEVTGYGSVFGGVDSYGDTIMPGAFQKSIGKRKPKMLWQHRMDMPIGVWDEVAEDGKGLRVKGRILSSVRQGADAIALIGAGALDGLSIGFRTMVDEVDGKVRKLKEVDLYEVSFVTMPADQKARVTGIKSEREVEDALRDMGFSRREAKAFIACGWKGVSNLRDAGESDDQAALRDAGMIKAELQRILEGLQR